MKRIRSIVLASVLIVVFCGAYAVGDGGTGNGFAQPPDTGEVFTDVPRDHWAYEDLQYLAARGIITGLPGGRFNGDEPMDRYTVAAYVARAIQYMQNNPESVTPQDLDVLKGLIYGVSDEVDALRAEIGQGGDAQLAARVSGNEQQISQLTIQVDEIAKSSPTTLARRTLQNTILAVTGLLIGIIAIALALMI